MESQPQSSLDPVSQQLNAGVELHRAGKIAEAGKIYRQVLVQQPNNPFALHLLGIVLGQTGQPQRAVELISRAISIQPDVADFHGNLAEFQRATGNLEQSIASFQRALALQPDNAVMRNGLGVSLAQSRQIDAAIAEFQRAIQLAPDYPDPHGNLAAALTSADRLDEAIAAAQTAIRLNPNYAGAYNNLANAQRAKGHHDDAIATLRKVAQIDPNDPKVHTNLGMSLLLLGDYTTGWREYDWRLHVPEFIHVRNYPQPRWIGSDLTGKTIFLYPEQGLGDVIQFARFIPQVAARGAKIILELQPPLIRLFQNFPGVSQILNPEDPKPNFDFHCPLICLAGALGITAESIPANIPYVKPDPNDVANWAKRFDRNDNRVRAGLVWAGRSTHSNDRNRSINPTQLTPLASAKNVAFYSLQKNDPSSPSPGTPGEGWGEGSSFPITDWATELTDFADTAALIENLDLVLTVDTSVAHLAGAMGKRVWIMLPHVPDWRWMLNSADSPWYPTAILFRQRHHGDWPDVLERVAAVLQNEIRT